MTAFGPVFLLPGLDMRYGQHIPPSPVILPKQNEALDGTAKRDQ